MHILHMKVKDVNWGYFFIGTLIKIQRNLHLFLDTLYRVMINDKYMKYRFTM